MKLAHARPKQSMFSSLAKLLTFKALLQGPDPAISMNPSMLTMYKMMHRENTNGGRMAFNSDFRRVRLSKIKARRGIR